MALPDWIENQAQEIKGMDLLGLRLPVQNISEYLLTGVTTISPRVRYLSLRSWIIKSFGLSGLPDTHEAFMDFVFRVECGLVIGMLLNNKTVTNIPGSDEARLMLEENPNAIQLKRLVKQTAYTIYTGPSNELLISTLRDNKVPALTTERGVQLAEAVESLLSGTEFVNMLRNNPSIDIVSPEVLREFGATLNIDSISTAERDLVVECIIPKTTIKHRKIDEQLRVGVYILLLELAKRKSSIPHEDDIFNAALGDLKNWPDSLRVILDGYVLYRVRDSIALMHEYVLEAVTNELSPYDMSVNSNEIINTLFSQELEILLVNIGLLESNDKLDKVPFNDFNNRVNKVIGSTNNGGSICRWNGRLNENTIISAILERKHSPLGLLPLTWILSRKRVINDEFLDIYPLSLLSRQGYARIGLKEVIIPELDRYEKENPTLDIVIAQMIRRSVDQHLRITWSRMFADIRKDGAAILADGDEWSYRRSFRTDRTASRIKEAIGWLRQLGLLNDEGITPDGTIVLKRGYEILDGLRADK